MQDVKNIPTDTDVGLAGLQYAPGRKPQRNCAAGKTVGGFPAFRAMTCGAVLVTALSGAAMADERPAAVDEPPGEAHGIAMQPVRVTAAGHLLDVRYRVTDPVKARKLFVPGVKPRLVDAATGKEFFTPSFPKVGALRQGSDKFAAGRIYFVMFENPGRRITAGDKVTLLVGETRIENLPVR